MLQHLEQRGPHRHARLLRALVVPSLLLRCSGLPQFQCRRISHRHRQVVAPMPLLLQGHRLPGSQTTGSSCTCSSPPRTLSPQLCLARSCVAASARLPRPHCPRSAKIAIRPHRPPRQLLRLLSAATRERRCGRQRLRQPQVQARTRVIRRVCPQWQRQRRRGCRCQALASGGDSAPSPPEAVLGAPFVLLQLRRRRQCPVLQPAALG
mmetsp:Transcript_86713/g.185773  ORF Transcript_86713/g.185773 Transcript_86713/m.185773 type:complete len:208 (+) Transcript_86713:427-1050(+)